MTVLPLGWKLAQDSSIIYCYEKRIDELSSYRCYIFTDVLNRLITGWGVRKDNNWIVPRTFPAPIPLTNENIQDRLITLIDLIFLYEL